VAPGTNTLTNPNCMASLDKNVIFTNVALTDDGDVWWEGMEKRRRHHAHAPDRLAGQGLDARHRQGDRRQGGAPQRALHRGRHQQPGAGPAWDDPAGVPIDAFIFGGRRSTTVPLVTEARNWTEGVYMAATMGSETTAAAFGQQGVVRRDPFAMLPFMRLQHERLLPALAGPGRRSSQPGRPLPRIYTTNWFRKDEDGKFVWPGYGENMRVLKWMIDRIEGKASGNEHVFGVSPAYEELNWTGLDFTAEQFKTVTSIDKAAWQKELELHAELFQQLAYHLPAELTATKAKIEQRLAA
jgi:phosphoenolpyruvate carboxykinase (GTP)